MSQARFTGKVALITGGATGIGLAVAKAFLSEGAKVVIGGRRTEVLNKAVTELKKIGNDVLAVQLDVAKLDSIENFVNQAVEEYKKIDFVINNAAIIGVKAPITKCTEADFDNVLSINIKGTYFSIQSAALQFQKQNSEGVIINIGSSAADANIPGLSAYNISKGALYTLTATAAKELAPKIRVNHVQLGPFETDMLAVASGRTAEGKKFFENLTLVKRVGDPSEAAALILFLCSDSAKFITGATYKINGGAGI